MTRLGAGRLDPQSLHALQPRTMREVYVGPSSTETVRALAFAIAIAGAILACAVRPAGATVVLGMDFARQSVTADRVFVGTVAAVESRPNPRAPRYFETLVRFAVDEQVVGDAPASITLRFSGGRVGDVEQVIDGMPSFTVGERYVVMADPESDPPQVSPIVGFNQGLYRVVTESAGSVVRDREGIPLPATDSASRANAAASDPSLAAFVAAIRAARAQ